jgi:CheY-like chemotaxis protein
MTRDYGHCLQSYQFRGRNRLSIFALVPLRRVPAGPVSAASGRESPLAADRLRVLVVEGEPFLRGMIVAALSMRGWMVRGAADGAEALEAAKALRPHVIVAQWSLPGSLTGYLVAEQLRVVLPGMGTVFLTDLPVEALCSRIRPLAPCALVEAPWEWEALAWAVLRVARVKQNIAR